MIYRMLADIILVLHLAFIVFVVFGGLFVLKWPRVAWVHVPSSVWGFFNETLGLWCPLTPLENWLRVRGGYAGYDTGFIEHYILPVVYPVGLTREMQIVFGGGVLIVNGVIYSGVIRRALRRRRA